MNTLFENIKQVLVNLLKKYKFAMSLYGEALMKGPDYGCA